LARLSGRDHLDCRNLFSDQSLAAIHSVLELALVELLSGRDGAVLDIFIQTLSRYLLRMPCRAARIVLQVLQESRVRVARKAIWDHRHLLGK
jgi:hypothetical protein